jgi:glycerol-3-phosphate acyltransferase PlsY
MTHPVVLFVVFPILSYVVGSVPFGLLLGRLRGVDIRQHGSGNIGATNAGRVLGRRWGYLCFLLDVAKGFAPVFVVGWLIRGAPNGVPAMAEQFSWLLAGIGALLGHVLPVWLGFKGGKGVATGLGVVVGFWPYLTVAGLIAFGLWIIVTGVSRYVSLGSVIAAGVFPLLVVGVNRVQLGSWEEVWELWPLLIFAIALPTLIIYRHRSNIGRLLAGTENKIGRKKD